MARASIREVQRTIRSVGRLFPNLSQAALATVLGVDQDTVSRWMHGRHAPTRARWAAFKWRMRQYFELDDQMRPEKK